MDEASDNTNETNETRDQVVRGIIYLVFTILAAIIIANPDLPAKLWYRFRLALAYRENSVNWGRLRQMRALRWAGYYDGDLVAEEVP